VPPPPVSKNCVEFSLVLLKNEVQQIAADYDKTHPHYLTIRNTPRNVEKSLQAAITFPYLLQRMAWANLN
jgi:hypothetical protein